jgi:hypothetical protein
MRATTGLSVIHPRPAAKEFAMRRFLSSSSIAGAAFVLFAALALSHGMLAQTAPRPDAAKPATASGSADLSGVWLLTGGNPFDLPRDAAPMQPVAKAKFDSERNGHGPNVVIDFASNTDPFIKSCDPLGVPRVLLANHPFKIVPAAGEMIILYERSHDFREIYMDGRAHPKDLDPTWWGHSIGHWEGDTLVVDTVGLNEKTWLDYHGLPHSDALHLIERYRRVDHDSMQLDLTIDDPKAYTKSWSVTKIYRLKPWDIGEDVCVVSNEKNFEQGIVKPASAPPAQ